MLPFTEFLPVVLLTDIFVWVMLLALLGYGWHAARKPTLAANWSLVFRRRTAMVSAVLLVFVLLVTLLDSLHFRVREGTAADGRAAYSGKTTSVLDLLWRPLVDGTERSYSAPLAYVGYGKESFERDGQVVRDYPRLKYGGAHLSDPQSQWLTDVLWRGGLGALGGLLIWAVLALVVLARSARGWHEPLRAYLARLRAGRTIYPVGTMLITLAALMLVMGVVAGLSTGYHVFGTARVGGSVLVMAMKSVRTAVVIGTLTTLVTLPFALLLGVLAGYLRGWVDEVIQYLYTVIASVPDVLLISAAMLMLLVFMDRHADLFPTALHRGDTRLFLLCVLLGLTSFTGMCRLVRAETMKLRELEYVQAARAFGVSTPRLLARHIVPNLAHLVLISLVLQFSGLVLGEAVLSYVGVGVDPSSFSFGVMITGARNELAAIPTIWWTLAVAFVCMFTIVLATNLFADAVRDAFDPRARLALR